jgi:hypothetical protein
MKKNKMRVMKGTRMTDYRGGKVTLVYGSDTYLSNYRTFHFILDTGIYDQLIEPSNNYSGLWRK